MKYTDAWPKPAVDELIKLILDPRKLSYGQMEPEMQKAKPGVSRNAILSFVGRILKPQPDLSPELRAELNRRELEAHSTRSGTSRARVPKPNKPTRPKTGFNSFGNKPAAKKPAADTPPAQEATPIVEAPISIESGVTVEEHTDAMCDWILGETEDLRKVFCKEAKFSPDKPYCEGHTISAAPKDRRAAVATSIAAIKARRAEIAARKAAAALALSKPS